MSDQNYNLDDLFHPKVELGEQRQSANLTEYQPSADKGQNGVYKSVIRFIAWWENPKNSITEKWVCWLVDPVTNRGRYVDCPSSVGKPSILQDMFFKLRKSESIQEQKKAEIFSRRHSFAAIIQVIKDDQNKEAEGKLMVWKFGKKIYEKLEAAKKPIVGNAHEPFDLLDGRAFAVVIQKSAGFNNYDQSTFLDTKVPLLLPLNEAGEVAEGGKLQPINDKTSREVVFNFLKENSPDLNKYAFREWDQETHDYVNQIIVAVTGQVPSTGYADVRNNTGSQVSASKPVETAGPGITTTELSLDDLDMGSNLGGLSGIEDLPDLNYSGDDGIGGIPGNLGDALKNL